MRPEQAERGEGSGAVLPGHGSPPRRMQEEDNIDSAGGIESRQGHGKNGAALGTVMASQLTQMPAHDAMRSAEAEPDALTDRLGGVERLLNTYRCSDPCTHLWQTDRRL